MMERLEQLAQRLGPVTPEALVDIAALHTQVELALKNVLRTYDCYPRMPGYFSQELAEARRQFITQLRRWPELHTKHFYSKGDFACLVCGDKRESS